MKISVIIPTFNRAHYLSLAINSLLNQTYNPDLYEIIISDNNSTDSTAELVKSYMQTNPGRIKYLKELRQGSHYARNSAAKIADGEILYFTDDDMIADPDLLSEITKVFEFDPEVASATGKVLPKWETTPPAWVLKLCYNGLLSLNDPPEEFVISSQDCNVYSCHQAVLKEVFLKSGGFNPDIIGDVWIGDNETGLNLKIKELGYKFGYNGKSITHHLIPSTRMTQAYLNRRLSNQGNCDSYTAYQKNKYSNISLCKQIIYHCFSLIFFCLKFLQSILRHKVEWRYNYAMMFYSINRMKYDFKLITDKKWREMVLKQNWMTE